ncbi:Uncharacterised protein g2641 [Pycnogonum litorale]
MGYVVKADCGSDIFTKMNLDCSSEINSDDPQAKCRMITCFNDTLKMIDECPAVEVVHSFVQENVAEMIEEYTYCHH